MTVGRSTSPTHQMGQKAEEAALRFLKQKGFQLVVQNFHCPMGELDLVMVQDRLLVFVEVRLRKTSIYGNAASSITPSKQRKIIQTSALFLQSFPEFDSYDCRFDVIAIDSRATNQNSYSQKIDTGIMIINWVEGAFDASIFYE
jgi:putative endonuclease